MKKILLIIIFIMAIFQLVVMATAIDIGSAAIDRVTSDSQNYVLVDQNTVATGTGVITSIEIYAATAMTGVEVATFYVVSGNNLSTRDNITLGSVAAEYNIFAVNLDVTSGDYIGIYYATGTIDRTTSGTGYWYVANDNIPCTNLAFTSQADRTISLCGTGTTDTSIITVGTLAVDRPTTTPTDYTIVDQNNPSNNTGIITSVEIYAKTGFNMANCQVATFYASGNNMTVRDYEVVNNGNGAGVVLGGSKQTFVVSLDVVAGDYLGIYFGTNESYIETTNLGVGYWYHAGDMIPTTSHEFTLQADRTMSLYGTGEVIEGGNAIMFGINF